MLSYIHINGTTYELAGGENLNQARERLNALGNRSQEAAEFVVSLGGIRVGLKVRGDVVGSWAAFSVDDKDKEIFEQLRGLGRA